jgi:hypothetical protein
MFHGPQLKRLDRDATIYALVVQARSSNDVVVVIIKVEVNKVEGNYDFMVFALRPNSARQLQMIDVSISGARSGHGKASSRCRRAAAVYSGVSASGRATDYAWRVYGCRVKPRVRDQASVVALVETPQGEGATVAVQAGEDVVPASALKAAQQRIKELERALGRKTMEVEILEAVRDEVKTKPHWYGVVKQ